MSIPDPDSPLVQEYLSCFSEVARLVNSTDDVPEALWTRIRETWAAMDPAEREEVENRTRGTKR